MNTALIVAAGKGRRFGGPVPKPYIELNGRPVLAWTVEAFVNAPCIDEIVVVVAADRIEESRAMLEDAGSRKTLRIVAGGEERTDSVYEGLHDCADADFVFIHDGARPCVSADVILRGLAVAREKGSAVAGLPARETVKRAAEDGRVLDTPDRASLWTIQTPQIFRLASVRAAYEAMRAACEAMREEGTAAPITDDAMVMERYGADPVYLYEGDPANIKITTGEDLRIAESLLV